MPYVPKPVLWWSSEDNGNGILSAVLTNKKVWLNGVGVVQHTPFQIRRRNLLTRIPWLGRRAFKGWVADVPTDYQGGDAMRSTTYWRATHVSGTPISSADYFFIDGNGGASGSLTVSNTPTFQWISVKRGGIDLNPQFEATLSSDGMATGSARGQLGYARKGYEFTFEGTILAPKDPNVEIEILEPQTSRDLLLETAHAILDRDLGDTLARQNPYLLGETLAWQNNPYLESALHHVDSFLGQRYVDFAVNGETRFVATPDDPPPISLVVRGEGPTRLLFAVQVRNLDTGTTSISEFMPVVVTQPRQG